MERRSHQVRLVLPVDPHYIRLSRLVAAGAALQAGFGVDDTDDLCIGIDELCSTLVEAGDPQGQVELALTVGSGIIEVSGRVATSGTKPAGDLRRELSVQLLAAVADEHELVEVDRELSGRLLRRRRGPPADITE